MQLLALLEVGGESPNRKAWVFPIKCRGFLSKCAVPLSLKPIKWLKGGILGHMEWNSEIEMQQGSVLTLKGWEYSPLNVTRNTQQGPYPATHIVLATPFWAHSMLDLCCPLWHRKYHHGHHDYPTKSPLLHENIPSWFCSYIPMIFPLRPNKQRNISTPVGITWFRIKRSSRPQGSPCLIGAIAQAIQALFDAAGQVEYAIPVITACPIVVWKYFDGHGDSFNG